MKRHHPANSSQQTSHNSGENANNQVMLTESSEPKPKLMKSSIQTNRSNVKKRITARTKDTATKAPSSSLATDDTVIVQPSSSQTVTPKSVEKESIGLVQGAETVEWATEFVQYESGTKLTRTLKRVFPDRSVKYGQLIDITNGNKAVGMIYRNVIPEKYELSSSIKDFVGNKSRFVGKWKRYVNSMSATADSRRLAKSQSYHAIVQELGPILHFLQEFMRRYLPGLYSHFKRTRKLFNNYVATVTKNPLMYQTQTPLSSTEIDVLSEDFMGIFTLFCLGHNSGRSEDIHVDGNNMQYGYNLLVPFGSFHGGVMQLPEVGVEIELMDRDLFVFDAVFYKHTLTKVIGERYSLIAFECRLAVKQMYEFNHITEASMAVGRYVDDNWFKHVGLTRRFNPLQTAV